MTTVICSSWVAPTTCMMSPAISYPGADEAMVAEHPGVAEVAVIGVAHQLKGQVPWRPSSVPQAGHMSLATRS